MHQQEQGRELPHQMMVNACSEEIKEVCEIDNQPSN